MIKIWNSNIKWFPIAVGTLLLMLELLPDELRSLLYFTSEEYKDGKWWLLLSCQWVHINFQHTIFNIAGLLVLCVVVLDRVSSSQLMLCSMSCLLCISIFLTLFPDIYAFYAGFSGVLYGLFFLGGVSYWRRKKMLSLILMLMLFVKLCWDLTGPSAFERVDWLGARIAIEVHIAGIFGSFMYCVSQVLRRSILNIVK